MDYSWAALTRKLLCMYLYIFLLDFWSYILSRILIPQFWKILCSKIYVYVCEGNGSPLQYSCLENPVDGGAWWAAVQGVTKSRIRLSNFTFAFHFHTLQKEMATHSSVLAWKIPGTAEPGRLPSMGSHRVGHDWSDLAASLCYQLPSFY